MRPRVEQLESRDTPSITLVGTTVEVVGTPAADSVLVYESGGNIVIERFGGGTSEQATFAPGQIDRVHADLLGGDDYYRNFLPGHPAAPIQDDVDGGDGNDYLYAGHFGGVLRGGNGNDWLFSNYHVGQAPLVLDGGAGADRIHCAPGADRVVFDPADAVFNFDPLEDSFV